MRLPTQFTTYNDETLEKNIAINAHVELKPFLKLRYLREILAVYALYHYDAEEDEILRDLLPLGTMEISSMGEHRFSSRDGKTPTDLGIVGMNSVIVDHDALVKHGAIIIHDIEPFQNVTTGQIERYVTSTAKRRVK